MRNGRTTDWGTAFLVIGLPFCVAFPPLLIVWVWVLLRKLNGGQRVTDDLFPRRTRLRDEMEIEHYRLTHGGFSTVPDSDRAGLEAARAEHLDKNCHLCRAMRRSGYKHPLGRMPLSEA